MGGLDDTDGTGASSVGDAGGETILGGGWEGGRCSDWEVEGRDPCAHLRSGVVEGEVGVEDEERAIFGVERDW